MDLQKIRKATRIGVASLAVVMSAGVGLTQAANGEIRAWNLTTGATSSNDTSVDLDETDVVRLVNRALTDNDVDIRARTGDNSADANTGDGEVDGGDIDGRLSFETILNSAARGFDLPELGDLDIEVGNETTGFSSDNDASVDVDQTREIDVRNIADVDNNISGSFITGRNSANRNTGDGRVTSGSASITADLSTDVNANSGSSFSLSGSGSASNGSYSVTNEETGANSDNDASIDVNRTTTITERNEGTVNNSVDFVIDTGDNSASRNTGDGSVRSGDADFDITVNSAIN